MGYYRKPDLIFLSYHIEKMSIGKGYIRRKTIKIGSYDFLQDRRESLVSIHLIFIKLA